MTGPERLRAVQERMIAAGVRDVKFTWGPDAATTPHDELCGQVADFLESFMNGEFTEMEFSDDGSDRLVPKKHGDDIHGEKIR